MEVAKVRQAESTIGAWRFPSCGCKHCHKISEQFEGASGTGEEFQEVFLSPSLCMELHLQRGRLPLVLGFCWILHRVSRRLPRKEIPRSPDSRQPLTPSFHTLTPLQTDFWSVLVFFHHCVFLWVLCLVSCLVYPVW